jgi:putative sigma-54 modulation protein
MRIEVRGKNFPLTPAITQYAETKCERLPRYYDRVQQINVTLEKSARHEEFTIEIIVDVEKHDDFVVRLTSHDVYEGIDLAIDKVVRQLVDFKERLKNPKH